MIKIRKRLAPKPGLPEETSCTRNERTIVLSMALLGLIFVLLTPSLISRLVEGVPLETLLSEASPFILLCWITGLLALLGFFAILITAGLIAIRKNRADYRTRYYASN